MKNPAFNRGFKKAIRTLIQLAAAGSLTALVSAVVGGLSPTTGPLILAAWGVLVAFLHNYLETSGTIPTLLPTPGLVTTAVGGVVGKAVGTVDAVTGAAGQVVGDVVNTAGTIVGAVAGAAGLAVDSGGV